MEVTFKSGCAGPGLLKLSLTTTQNVCKNTDSQVPPSSRLPGLGSPRKKGLRGVFFFFPFKALGEIRLDGAACSPSTWGTKAEGLLVQGQPGPYSKAWFPHPQRERNVGNCYKRQL